MGRIHVKVHWICISWTNKCLLFPNCTLTQYHQHKIICSVSSQKNLPSFTVKFEFSHWWIHEAAVSQKLGGKQIACGRDYGHWGQCGIKWYNFGKLWRIECYIMKIQRYHRQRYKKKDAKKSIMLSFFFFDICIDCSPVPRQLPDGWKAKSLSWDWGYCHRGPRTILFKPRVGWYGPNNFFFCFFFFMFTSQK